MVLQFDQREQLLEINLLLFSVSLKVVLKFSISGGYAILGYPHIVSGDDSPNGCIDIIVKQYSSPYSNSSTKYDVLDISSK